MRDMDWLLKVSELDSDLYKSNFSGKRLKPKLHNLVISIPVRITALVDMAP